MTATPNSIEPLTVYGVDLSYFTGKFEAYLRYRGIDYVNRDLGIREYLWTVPRALGATQYPSVRLADGRWMSDTTPMIAFLEAELRPDDPDPVIPVDPATSFIAHLIEDYGDEWLWRPAMHYRWSYEPDARRASKRLAETVVRLPLPFSARRWWVRRRQTTKFVLRDGVADDRTREGIDQAYLRLLAAIDPLLAERPFLLGPRPTIADFGLFGSMFRHFYSDPTPGAMMRERAPAAHAWVERLWETRSDSMGAPAEPPTAGPELEPLLGEVTATLLPQLEANAAAHRRGRSHHDLEVEGVTYPQVPTSPYRVWVLEQMQDRWAKLTPDDQGDVLRQLGLDQPPPVFTDPAPESGHDPDGSAPFCRVTRMVRD